MKNDPSGLGGRQIEGVGGDDKFLGHGSVAHKAVVSVDADWESEVNHLFEWMRYNVPSEVWMGLFIGSQTHLLKTISHQI